MGIFFIGGWFYQEGQQVLLGILGQPVMAEGIEAKPLADRPGYRPRGSLTSTSSTRQVAVTYRFLESDELRQGTTIVNAGIADLRTLTDQEVFPTIAVGFLPFAPNIHAVIRPLREDLFMIPIFGLACLGFGIAHQQHHRKATNT